MEEEKDPFVYSRAVVCGGVASSLPAAALRMAEPGQGVDLDKARQQHQKYTEVKPSKVMQKRVPFICCPGSEDSCEGGARDSSGREVS